MIVTKAYVTEIPEQDSNIFKVRVPLMEDNTETEAEFDAILSTSAGTYKDINVDDCVIVTFEDDKYDLAIILGKLFTEIPESTMAYGLFNQLKVTGSVELPKDTKIGDFTPQDIYNLYQGVNFGGNGGGGSVDPDELKQYVQWTNTERSGVDIFANHIRVMTGEEYDAYKESEDFDEDLFNETLYFLSSLPESDELGD